MSVSITRSTQLVHYFGPTKNIVDVTNYSNMQTIFKVSAEGGFESWTRANIIEGTPTFNAFDQLENGVGYLIISESTAPSSYDLDSGVSISQPASTSVENGIAIKQYQGTFDLSSSDPFRDNLNELFILDANGDYLSWSKSNTDTVFNGFNELVSGETYLIFSDPTLTFPADNYSWATFTSGNSMYALCPDDDLIKVLDTASHAVIDTIDVGDSPVDMVMVDNLIYVVNKFSQTISIVDTITNTVVDSILLYDTIGRQNYSFTFQPSFISSFEDSGDILLAVGSETSSVVLIVDANTRRITEKISLDSDIDNISSLYVLNKLSSTDDRIVYVSDKKTNQVLRIEDKQSYSVLDQLIVGLDTNDRLGDVIAISRNGNHLAASTENGDSVVGYALENNRWEYRGFYSSTQFASVSSLSVTDDGEIGIGWSKHYLRGTSSLQDYGTLQIIKFIPQISAYVNIKPDIIQLEGSTNPETSQFGSSIDISNNGDRVVVGAPSNQANTNGTLKGAVYVYDWDSANFKWDLVGDIITNPTSSSLGQSVSINDEGTYIAVGDDNSSLFYRNGGAVYVYSLVNSAWEIYGPIIPPVAGKVLAGKKVSISDLGSRVMVQHRDSLAVYAYNGSSSYSMVGSPISISPNDSCSFSKDGDHILIGNPNSGVVRSYEYVLSNLDFSLVGDPIESDPIILFGKSTSISKDGSSIAVSAPLYNSVLSVENVGGAAVYKYEK